MTNELIQTYPMVFKNFWYIEHYGEDFGDDFDAKMSTSNISNGRISSENMTLKIKVTPQIIELKKRPISYKNSIILV